MKKDMILILIFGLFSFIFFLTFVEDNKLRKFSLAFVETDAA